MPIKQYNPTSNGGRRHSSVLTTRDLTQKRPEKSLIIIKKGTGGRNFMGRVTVRHQGGGEKQFIRIIDWRQEKYDLPAKVETIEYDPGRGARIVLLKYGDGEKRYVIAPQDIVVGDTILSSTNKIEAKNGNRMPLQHIPVGTLIHNLELAPGKGGEMVRGAGMSAQLMALEGDYAQVKLPSTEVRMIAKECMATIGTVGNADHRLIRWGKAGRMRHRGIRPTVRGKAMNPVDHPHGGGEGRSSIGLKQPKTPWGKKALGVKTRKAGQASDKFIVHRRVKAKGRGVE